MNENDKFGKFIVSYTGDIRYSNREFSILIDKEEFKDLKKAIERSESLQQEKPNHSERPSEVSRESVADGCATNPESEVQGHIQEVINHVGWEIASITEKALRFLEKIGIDPKECMLQYESGQLEPKVVIPAWVFSKQLESIRITKLWGELK